MNFWQILWMLLIGINVSAAVPLQAEIGRDLPSNSPAEFLLLAAPPTPSKTIEIYVADWCPHCRRLESYLNSKKIRFTRYDIDASPAGASRYRALGGGGIPLVKIGDEVIRGFNQPAIERALKE